MSDLLNDVVGLAVEAVVVDAVVKGVKKKKKGKKQDSIFNF
jgi:hypothetical protein